jgi:hypothetical protein
MSYQNLAGDNLPTTAIQYREAIRASVFMSEADFAFRPAANRQRIMYSDMRKQHQLFLQRYNENGLHDYDSCRNGRALLPEFRDAEQFTLVQADTVFLYHILNACRRLCISMVGSMKRRRQGGVHDQTLSGLTVMYSCPAQDEIDWNCLLTFVKIRQQQISQRIFVPFQPAYRSESSWEGAPAVWLQDTTWGRRPGSSQVSSVCTALLHPVQETWRALTDPRRLEETKKKVRPNRGRHINAFIDNEEEDMERRRRNHPLGLRVQPWNCITSTIFLPMNNVTYTQHEHDLLRTVEEKTFAIIQAFCVRHPPAMTILESSEFVEYQQILFRDFGGGRRLNTRRISMISAGRQGKLLHPATAELVHHFESTWAFITGASGMLSLFIPDAPGCTQTEMFWNIHLDLSERLPPFLDAFLGLFFEAFRLCGKLALRLFDYIPDSAGSGQVQWDSPPVYRRDYRVGRPDLILTAFMTWLEQWINLSFIRDGCRLIEVFDCLDAEHGGLRPTRRTRGNDGNPLGRLGNDMVCINSSLCERLWEEPRLELCMFASSLSNAEIRSIRQSQNALYGILERLCLRLDSEVWHDVDRQRLFWVESTVATHFDRLKVFTEFASTIISANAESGRESGHPPTRARSMSEARVDGSQRRGVGSSNRSDDVAAVESVVHRSSERLPAPEPVSPTSRPRDSRKRRRASSGTGPSGFVSSRNAGDSQTNEHSFSQGQTAEPVHSRIEEASVSGDQSSQLGSDGGSTSDELSSSSGTSRNTSSDAASDREVNRTALVGDQSEDGTQVNDPVPSEVPVIDPVSSGVPVGEQVPDGTPVIDQVSSGVPVSDPVSSGVPASDLVPSGVPVSDPVSSGVPVGDLGPSETLASDPVPLQMPVQENESLTSDLPSYDDESAPDRLHGDIRSILCLRCREPCGDPTKTYVRTVNGLHDPLRPSVPVKYKGLKFELDCHPGHTYHKICLLRSWIGQQTKFVKPGDFRSWTASLRCPSCKRPHGFCDVCERNFTALTPLVASNIQAMKSSGFLSDDEGELTHLSLREGNSSCRHMICKGCRDLYENLLTTRPGLANFDTICGFCEANREATSEVWKELRDQRVLLMNQYVQSQASLPEDQTANAVLQGYEEVIRKIYLGDYSLLEGHFRDFCT